MINLRDHQGRAIRLTEERRAHILAHPELREMEAEITRTLREPESIIRSRSDEAVRLFYRYQEETVVGSKWLCVVVKYGSDDPFILTAYLTDRPKTGDVLWPKP